MTSKKDRHLRQHLIALAIIAVVSFITYGNTLTGEFIWDDRELILDNYYVKNWENLPTIFSSDFFFTSRKEGKMIYTGTGR